MGSKWGPNGTPLGGHIPLESPLGSQNGSKWGPEVTQNRSKIGPKYDPKWVHFRHLVSRYARSGIYPICAYWFKGPSGPYLHHMCTTPEGGDMDPK